MEMEKEGIKHWTVEVNGIKMHVAEKGSGPVVLMLHGFPQLWYCWRHQIVGLAAKGYRAVAPDMRGYGGTDAPTSFTSYTYFHLAGDIVALINALGVDQVYLVGHDWGAVVGWFLCLLRPDKVKAYVALSVPFMPRPPINPVGLLHRLYGDNYSMIRFQEPEAVQEDFACIGTEKLIKIFLTLRDPGPLIVPKGGFKDWPHKQIILPSWLTQDDIDCYVENFDKAGFTGGLNYYRVVKLDWELTAPWTATKVKVAVKYVAGELDLVYNTMGNYEYINSGNFKRDVPSLEEIVIIEGAGHFIQEERPQEITAHIYNFIQKH